jgi:hypothetical protein
LSRFHNFWLAALALSITCSARANALIPTTLGASWEYAVTDSSTRPGAITVAIVGREEVAGREVFKLETRSDDVLRKTELIAVDERALVCLRRSWPSGKTVSFDPPQGMLPAELKVGAKWELDDDVAGVDMHQRFTVGAEGDVVVPAGTFHAYRFDCEEPWPLSIAIQRWFSPGTGFIKDITTTRGPTGRLLSRVTTALTKFSSAIAATPNESPSPSPSPTAAPLPAKVTLAVAKVRDGEPATEFGSDALHIFVRWIGEHLPVGGKVRVVWIAEDVGDIAPPNFVVDETTTIIDTTESGVQFTLSRPKDGWAVGTYRVELYLDDNLMESMKVTIAERTADASRLDVGEQKRP